MAAVRIELPSVLASVLGGLRTFEVRSETLEGALRTAVAEHPPLRALLMDEAGDLREHVLCFHNRTNTRWLQDRLVPVEDGDVICFLQAVSGG